MDQLEKLVRLKDYLQKTLIYVLDEMRSFRVAM
jgi:hypothetical protein